MVYTKRVFSRIPSRHCRGMIMSKKEGKGEIVFSPSPEDSNVLVGELEIPDRWRTVSERRGRGFSQTRRHFPGRMVRVHVILRGRK